MTCAPGTLFNARLSMCDHPKNVDCDNFNRPILPTTKPTPTAMPTVPTENEKMVEQCELLDFVVNHSYYEF